MKTVTRRCAALWLLLCLLLSACGAAPVQDQTSFDLDQIPAFSDEPYVILTDNQPAFTQEDLEQEVFETYSPLDTLGRCTQAYANVGPELMPTEERGSISQVKPSGWQTATYDIVDGGYLYNRCHLIGFQLTGENANEENLITGTRYLNVEGMLPFENMVADYIQDTGNHVLYRVTPIFEGTNLVASGVELEAMSVEDQGEGIQFHVYCYNNQPGVTIDYATGNSRLADGSQGGSASQQPDASQSQAQQPDANGDDGQIQDYVINTSSGKFHLPDCSGVASMSPKNRQDYTGTYQSLLDQGYSPCGICLLS